MKDVPRRWNKIGGSISGTLLMLVQELLSGAQKKMSLRFWLILCGNITAILAKVRHIVEYTANADFYDI